MTQPDRAALHGIAARFLPSRWHYHYVRSKLASDPLYAGVAGALEGSDAALLDLGCGVGLLAHYLHACGFRSGYRGIDNDSNKIELARAVAADAGLTQTRFDVIDLAEAVGNGALAGHRGSVAILDLLQFLPPPAQAPLLRSAAACLVPGARLIIRTGLEGSGWRARITRAVDWLSRWLRWMNTGPKAYPTREGLTSLLNEAGLAVCFSPLWGGTPFNNWLVVAEIPTSESGSTQR
ncbi:MAG: class I SAM-dependent methyltransferase [Pseudomarimonas sp.]